MGSVEVSCRSVSIRNRPWRATSYGCLLANQGVERFAIVIHQEPEAGYRAEVPALPGCYSQGETIEDLKANVREAIEGVLDVIGAKGKQPERNIQILDVAV
jgi:predicted RNase H-like HicB family nuclease